MSRIDIRAGEHYFSLMGLKYRFPVSSTFISAERFCFNHRTVTLNWIEHFKIPYILSITPVRRLFKMGSLTSILSRRLIVVLLISEVQLKAPLMFLLLFNEWFHEKTATTSKKISAGGILVITIIQGCNTSDNHRLVKCVRFVVFWSDIWK